MEPPQNPGRFKRAAGIEAISWLQDHLVALSYRGQIPPADCAVIVMHSLPEPAFFVDDLVGGLAKLTEVRRRAVLFALETEMLPERASRLTWLDVTDERHTGSVLVREILDIQNATRTARLPYVFWEWATPTIAAPLMHLQDATEEAFCCRWLRLQERYCGMVMVHGCADADHLLGLASEFHSGLL